MGSRGFVAAILCCSALPAAAQLKSVNPRVTRIVSEVSEDRIESTLRKLGSFGTRNLLSSQDDPQRGIGAARKWIFEELRGYSPRLEVSWDHYRLKKIEARNSRVPRDVDLYNIVAVLPGKTHPDQRVIVSAHYDTIALRQGGGGADGIAAGGDAAAAAANFDPEADAPGVTDDGSGTACVMELARVMSQYEFDKTIVFLAFSGEEEGLLGATLYAARAKETNARIEAVLNNDIIGSERNPTGRVSNRRVSVFADDPLDSPSRTVGRYFREIAERYVPSMTVDLIFRADRLGRGGDHTPFNLEGFGAVRLSSPVENFSHQHTATDTFDNVAVPYVAQVTRLNGAVAASLAWGPVSPVVSEEVEQNGQKTTRLLLTRGTSRYDALLKWKESSDPDLAGYAIVMRSTTAPFWDREIYVGNVTEYTMKDVSIDEVVFGVKAVDKEGNESLVSPYVPTPRTKRVIEVY